MTRYEAILMSAFICLMFGYNWTLQTKKAIDKTAFFDCFECKDGYFKMEIPLKEAKWMYDKLVNSSENSVTFHELDNLVIKKRLEECKICQVGYIACKPASVENYLACSNRTAFFGLRQNHTTTAVNKTTYHKKFADSLPLTIEIPIGGLKNHSRHTRMLKSCAFPTTFTTSTLSCKIFPKHITCIQNCAFGYTTTHGIHHEMTCNFKDNTWKPNGFEECRPFLGCSLKLLSGGASNCTSMSLWHAPECRVECHPYELRPGVPEQLYSCDKSGKWNPELPFCVTSETGLVLVHAPRIKFHTEPDARHKDTKKHH